MTVYVVRHGESTWNANGRTQGQIAHPWLTARGVEQARAAAAAVAGDLGSDRGVDLVRTSDLVRARQTADEVSRLLGGRVEEDSRLREQSYGMFDGAQDEFTREALAKLVDGSDAARMALPHGESADAVRTRVRAALADLPRDLVVVVVGHGDALRLALGSFPVPAGTISDPSAPWPNGAVAAVEPDGSLRPVAVAGTRSG